MFGSFFKFELGSDCAFPLLREESFVFLFLLGSLKLRTRQEEEEELPVGIRLDFLPSLSKEPVSIGFDLPLQAISANFSSLVVLLNGGQTIQHQVHLPEIKLSSLWSNG